MRIRNRFAELVILISQNLFFVRGGIRRVIIKSIEKIINYSPEHDPEQSRIKTKVNGVPFYFYFDYQSDVKLAFGNYNKKEIDFLKRHMEENSNFIDIGSNIGFYSLNIANIYPKINFSKIISIEPNHLMIARQKENIELLDEVKNRISEKIIIENYALSDNSENLQLNLDKGYGSASLKVDVSKNSISVKTITLTEILERNEINYITCLKIDIEGYEDRALIPFFESAPKSLYPKHIVMEYTSMADWKNLNLINFLEDIGYELQFKTKANICLSLRL